MVEALEIIETLVGAVLWVISSCIALNDASVQLYKKQSKNTPSGTPARKQNIVGVLSSTVKDDSGNVNKDLEVVILTSAETKT